MPSWIGNTGASLLLVEKRNHDNDILIKRQRLINMERQEIEERESVLEYLRLKREKEYERFIEGL